MFIEKNISKIIFIIPSLSILFTSLVITLLITKKDYEQLDSEIKQIRISYIKNEKKNSNKESSLSLFQDDVLNFIKNIINTKKTIFL